MKIVKVNVIPLIGGTVDGGWPQGHEKKENLHTLLEVLTDEGITGVGGVYTSGALTEGALGLLWPLLKNESAVEPERVTEKLRQSTFWQGRGGSVEHAISGLDIALWDIMGKVCKQPVSRLLGGNYRDRIKPYGSILFDEPDALRTKLQDVVGRGFKAIKMGWRPFGRRDRKFDELLVRTAREAVGEKVELMVDAGGSEQFWPHGVNWARETAKMLAGYDIVWFEEALPPDDIEGYIELTKQSPVPIATGEVLTLQAVVHALDRTPCGRYHSARLHEERRPQRVAEDRLVRVRSQRADGLARMEHGRGPGCRPATGGSDARSPLRRIPHAVRLHRRHHDQYRSSWTPKGT